MAKRKYTDPHELQGRITVGPGGKVQLGRETVYQQRRTIEPAPFGQSMPTTKGGTTTPKRRKE